MKPVGNIHQARELLALYMGATDDASSRDSMLAAVTALDWVMDRESSGTQAGVFAKAFGEFIAKLDAEDEVKTALLAEQAKERISTIWNN